MRGGNTEFSISSSCQLSAAPPAALFERRLGTLNGPERGLLLLRVRDEIRMTIDAYKTLYDSSVTFGVRKQLQAEQGMSDMETKVNALKENKATLENQVLELRNKVEIVEKRAAERRQLDDKKQKEEISFLKYQGQNLDQFLRSITGAK